MILSIELNDKSDNALNDKRDNAMASLEKISKTASSSHGSQVTT